MQLVNKYIKLDAICTWKHARCGGFSGRVEPILLTTLRVDPCGLFCQIGITSCKTLNKVTLYTNYITFI